MNVSLITMALVLHTAMAPPQPVACIAGSPCQLAAAVVTHTLERFANLDGRNVFVDMQSFASIATLLRGTFDASQLRAGVEHTFRTDVENTREFRPGEGYTHRWANDPLVILVDSAFRRGTSVVVHTTERFNVRRGDAIHATAVYGDLRKWEYELALRDGRWEVTGFHRRRPPF